MPKWTKSTALSERLNRKFDGEHPAWEPWWRSVAHAPLWVADVLLAAFFAGLGWITGGDPGWWCPTAFVLGVVIFRLLSARTHRREWGIETPWWADFKLRMRSGG